MSSTTTPPNITALLVPGRVLTVNPAKGGGDVPVTVGTVQWAIRNNRYNYHINKVIKKTVIPGEEETHRTCASFVYVRLGSVGWGMYTEWEGLVAGVGPNPPIVSK